MLSCSSGVSSGKARGREVTVESASGVPGPGLRFFFSVDVVG